MATELVERFIQGKLSGIAGSAAAEMTPLPNTPFLSRPSLSRGRKYKGNFDFFSTQAPQLFDEPVIGSDSKDTDIVPEGTIFEGTVSTQAQAVPEVVPLSMEGDFSPAEKKETTSFFNIFSAQNKPEAVQAYVLGKAGAYFDPKTEFNIGTGKPIMTDLGGGFNMILGPLAGVSKFAGKKVHSTLENIAAKAALGEKGFAIGMYDGKPVGLSTGIFGPQLTGVYDEAQRDTIIKGLQNLEAKGAGAGALGQASSQYKSRDETMTQSDFDLNFEKTIQDSTLSNELKNKILRVQEQDPVTADIFPTEPAPVQETITQQQTPIQETITQQQTPVQEDKDPRPADSGTSFKDIIEKGQEAGKGYKGGYGFQEGGFVGGPAENYTDAQGVADDISMDVKEGSFIIRHAAADEIGEKNVRTMMELAEAIDKEQKNVNIDYKEGGKVPINISRGEVVIPPNFVDIIGMDNLERLNKLGDPPIPQNKNDNNYQDGTLVKDEGTGYEMPSEELMAKLKEFNKSYTKGNYKNKTSTRNRKERDSLINSLTDQEALALAILTETYASKTGLSPMQKIGDVIMNRVNDKQFDFKNSNTIKEALLHRSSRGTGSKMTEIDGLEPMYLQARISEILSGNNPDAMGKVLSAAANTLDTEPDLEKYRLPSHILFYAKPSQSGSSFHDENPYLEPLLDDEGHIFYGRFHGVETMGDTTYKDKEGNFQTMETPKAFGSSRIDPDFVNAYKRKVAP